MQFLSHEREMITQILSLSLSLSLYIYIYIYIYTSLYYLGIIKLSSVFARFLNVNSKHLNKKLFSDPTHSSSSFSDPSSLELPIERERAMIGSLRGLAKGLQEQVY